MKRMMLITLSLFLSHSAIAGIDPKEAYSQVKQDTAVLIDVREEEEVKDGMINRSIWFPLSRINLNDQWKKNFEIITKGKNIFLYCRSGTRAVKVENILRSLGIKSESIGAYEDLKLLLR
jgi:phage shock protein E